MVESRHDGGVGEGDGCEERTGRLPTWERAKAWEYDGEWACDTVQADT